VTFVLHDERPVGPGECLVCEAPVVRALDEFFRLVTLDPEPVEDGAWIWGSEVDGVGDQPDPAIRAHRATENDRPGKRWRLHVCP
jgi:hypothetical protein